MQAGDDAGSGAGQGPADGFDPALGASYVLEERLGRGATGEVWRATDRRTGERVAAKLLRAEHVADRDLVSRFVRERSILTGLRHPGVVAVRDLVVEGERLAIVMDLVDGGSLRDVLDADGPLPPALALDVTAAVLDGLAGAHDHGVLHRDVKPDNVLLDTDWRRLEPGDVRITDFGISRIVSDGAGTTTGLLGTPEYMSPELLTSGTADLPADVYGVGVLLYELLAGRTPFAGPGTDYTVAHRHVTVQPPPLPLPEPVTEVLDALLGKDPSRRPTASVAAARLRRVRADHPELADLAPLAVEAPTDFAPLERPATVVRGLKVDTGEPAPAPEEPQSSEPVDLGESSQQTMVRPMVAPARPAAPARAEATTPATTKRPPWKDPRTLALVGGGLALVLVAVGFTVLRGGGPGGGSQAQAASGTQEASQEDQALPTGLTTSRSATYDAEQGLARLVLTYAADRAPLEGPFLEVLPGVGGRDCAAVTWAGGDQQRNLPTTTGISADCGWSVDPGVVEPGSPVTVEATVGIDLGSDGGSDGGSDPQGALQEWLDGAAESTSAALTDPATVSTSYPVQRLQGIEVRAPSRTTSPQPLELSLLPSWPSGPDELNPLYVSPSVGAPSSLLQAVAGGEAGVRFTDGCGGALAVSPEGLTVTTLRPAEDCVVRATVGNFADLESNSFEIVSRGS